MTMIVLYIYLQVVLSITQLLSLPPGFTVQVYNLEWDVCNTEFVIWKDVEGIARSGEDPKVGVARTGRRLVVGVHVAMTGGGLEELDVLSKNCTSATSIAAFVK